MVKYYGFYFPIKVNNYYLALGLLKEGDINTEIVVLDKSGQLVQTIKGNYWNLRAVENGFAVTNIKANINSYMMNSSEAQNNNTEVYSIFNVKTKTDGNGTISYTRKVVDGVDMVEFTITPNKGYTLGSVKVTDSKGNILIVQDYSFVMPSADVLIEAKFVPINAVNPDTGTIISIGLFSLFFITGLVFIKMNKKRMWLK